MILGEEVGIHSFIHSFLIGYYSSEPDPVLGSENRMLSRSGHGFD